jgi:uncharacterized membrane protein YcjF (UPF0283 family)
MTTPQVEEEEEGAEDEMERARRRAPSEWRDVSIAAGALFALAVILFLMYGVPAG